ncbi:SpoIID/LytB domain-containing protein [bacterium]|nr:MAG: SpoIID/LytB domain-containing protein [bacterium]
MLSAPLALLLALPASARSPRAEAAAALWRRGEVERAAREFEADYRADPKDPASALDAAAAWREAEDHKKAAALFAEAAKSGDPDALSALGWEAGRAGDVPGARKAFEAALTSAPANVQALLGLTRLELKAGRPREAAAAAQRAAAAKPTDALVLAHLARAREALGEDEAAATAWERAIEADGTYLETRLALGAAYKRLGRANDAWRQYVKVLSADSKNPTAKRESAALRASLTRRPEEIVPARTLKSFLPVVPAQPGRAPLLRVAVGTTNLGKPAPRPEVAFLCDGPFELYDPAGGKRLLAGPAKEAWTARRARKGSGYEVYDASGARKAGFKKALGVRPLEAGRSLIVQRLDIAQGTAWAVQGDRQLKGALELRGAGRAGLTLVNIVALEDYLYGVVNEEMPGKFHTEALKAQAVIARNHALIVKDHWKPHHKSGYDLCDGQHCQVYGGVAAETDKGRRAVDETHALALTYAGKLAQTPYSSNCGGHTQASAETGGWFKAAYLTGAKDADGGVPEPKSPWENDRWLKTNPAVYCNIPEYMHPSHFRWSRAIDVKDLEERLKRRKRGGVGTLKRVRILQRSVSGNVNKVAFEGTKGRVVVDKEAGVRGVFSTSSLRDTMFLLEAERDAKGRLVELLVYGGGWGHNVGLCQYGALGRALKGQDFRTILAHYFPGADLKRLDY